MREGKGSGFADDFAVLTKFDILANLLNMAKSTKPAGRRFAKTVTATDLSNRSGDILLESERGPVGVLRHGKPRYVILNVDAYESLRRGADARRAYRTRDLPPDLLDAILKSMKEHVDRSRNED